MARFTYADYDAESTDAARLTACRAFIAELREEMARPSVSHGASSRSSAEGALQALHAQAIEDRDRYEKRVARASGTGGYAAFGNA